jgi:hypothetical protein
MTIKRNGEKVILKGGKVSCSCCEGPGECCMYPAQALADGLYSASDLPDALSHISRNGTIRNIFRSGTDYLVADGPLGKIGAEFDATGSSIPLWLFYDDAGSQAGSRCLFQKFAGLPPGYPVEDQFADTYTVDIASGALVVQVERFAVYGWISEVIQEGDNYFCIILAYCEYGGPSYGFGLTKSNNFDNQTDASAQRQSYIDKLIYVFQTGLNPKIGFNNTPEGSYPWFSTTATVS